jgi:hypothetical protein
MERKLPDPQPVMTLNGDSEAFVVKYNIDGNYVMSGHSDRSIKV